MATKKSKNQGKIHTLFLYTGYAEDSSFAGLIAYNENGFDDISATLKDLAGKIIEHNMMEMREELKRKTCSHKLGTDDKFCPKCGAPRKSAPLELPEQEEVESWMRDFIHSSADGAGYLWQYLYENGWTCGFQAVSPKSLSSGVVMVQEYAETLLWAAYTGNLAKGKYRGKDDDADFSLYLENHIERIC